MSVGKLKSALLFIGLILFLSGHSYSQDEKPVRLLEKWIGSWEGSLEITTVEGKNSQIDMRLEISETDTPGVFKWILKYSGSDRLSGNYLLRVQNSGAGTYILDENNSMKIDYYLYDNTFYASFSSQGSLLSSKYRLAGDNIYFEVVTSSMNNSNISADSSEENNLVYSYPVFALQKAVLQKK